MVRLLLAQDFSFNVTLNPVLNTFFPHIPGFLKAHRITLRRKARHIFRLVGFVFRSPVRLNAHQHRLVMVRGGADKLIINSQFISAFHRIPGGFHPAFPFGIFYLLIPPEFSFIIRGRLCVKSPVGEINSLKMLCLCAFLRQLRTKPLSFNPRLK